MGLAAVGLVEKIIFGVERLSPITSWLLGLISLALVGVLDWIAGSEISFLALYSVPIFLIAWRLGIPSGLAFSILSGGVWLAAERFANVHLAWGVCLWNAGMRMLFFVIFAGILGALVHTLRQRDRLISELRAAADQVRTLQELLPICPCCRRIRSNAGRWNTLEHYLRDQSNVEFLASVCPDCVGQVFSPVKSSLDK